MKKIILGKFFDKDIFLETEDNDNFDYLQEFQDYKKEEKESAIRQYEDELFLKDIKSKLEK